jgi:thiol-disulfide isomerase/thioredoxin
MDEIIAKYRGKVVVVDFWATWCQACLQMMQAANKNTILQFFTLIVI